MSLHAHKERTDCIELTEIAKDFVSINEEKNFLVFFNNLKVEVLLFCYYDV